MIVRDRDCTEIIIIDGWSMTVGIVKLLVPESIVISIAVFANLASCKST